MQITQQIFVAEEWAKNSREELNADVQSCLIVEKAVGTLKLEKECLNKEIKEAFKARDSAEVGLKTTTKQAKDILQQLHLSEINLATEKQMVSDLKAQLLQAKEVAGVCRDYVTESWGVAMDRAAVPANSDLRRLENIFFPEDIHYVLGSDPPEEPPFAPTNALDSIIPEGKEGNEEA